MEEIRIIEVKQSVFEDNNKDAEELRKKLKEEKTFLLNLMSSPGSGKTTTLKALAKELFGKLRWAVMEADIDSAVDAEAMVSAGDFPSWRPKISTLLFLKTWETLSARRNSTPALPKT